MNIKFGRDGKEIGEYPEEAVPALLQSKVLRGTDLFWHEGMAEWSAIASRWREIPPMLPPVVQSVGGRVCPHCGSHSVAKIRGLQGGEVFVAILLFFFFIIPGIIYYIYIESVPYCSGCGRRV